VAAPLGQQTTPAVDRVSAVTVWSLRGSEVTGAKDASSLRPIPQAMFAIVELTHTLTNPCQWPQHHWQALWSA
jgi:hypothetical protein